MYHFGANIHFETENVICLNIVFLSFYKIILIVVINIYLYIYICVPRSAHILY